MSDERREEISQEIRKLVALKTAEFVGLSKADAEKFDFNQALFEFFKEYQKIDKSVGNKLFYEPPIEVKGVSVGFFNWARFENDLKTIPDLSKNLHLKFVDCKFVTFQIGSTHNNVNDKVIGDLTFERSCVGFYVCLRHSRVTKFGVNFLGSHIGDIQLTGHKVLDSYYFFETKIGSLYAEDAVFTSPVIVSKSEIGVPMVWEKFSFGAIRPSLLFRGTRLHELLDFNNTTFHKIPIFEVCEGIENAKFDHLKIKDFKNSTFREFFSLRSLKGQAQKNHDEYTAMLLYSYELEARHDLILIKAECLSSLWFERVFSSAYSRFSSYGRDLLMPVIWWLYFLVMIGLSYYGMEAVKVVDKNITSPWVDSISDNGAVYLNLFYSLKMMLGPLGALLNSEGLEFTNWVGRFVGFLQQVGSSLALFMWLMQIRQRFKIS